MKTCLGFLFALPLLCLKRCTGYDSNTPDTERNKKAFKSMTGLVPDFNIKGIYAHAEEFFGFDSLYCMAFTAPPEAVARIVEKRNMKKMDTPPRDEDFSVPEPLKWWNAEERKISDYYVAEVMRDGTTDVVYYLRHDPKTGKYQFMVVYF